MVYAQVEVVGDAGLVDSDCVVTNEDGILELIFRDLEFIETRRGRDPSAGEETALRKLKSCLEDDQTVFSAGLDAEEVEALATHGFATNKPVVVATEDELGFHRHPR